MHTSQLSLTSADCHQVSLPVPAGPPTLLHVTHWKAGSQWIHRILIGLAYASIVPPRIKMRQILKEPILEGHVYPTVYLTREELESLPLPRSARRFVVIRDLRDTLVSLYYSMKISHPMIAMELMTKRALLGQLTLEEGLLFLLAEELPKCSEIQQSWVASGEPLIRYEDLLENDVAILEQVLIDRCGMQVTRDRLREVVVANRFEQITGGRTRGQEVIAAHERKGIVGDWRNHFTPCVKNAFKARFGELLMATGYESNERW